MCCMAHRRFKTSLIRQETVTGCWPKFGRWFKYVFVWGWIAWQPKDRDPQIRRNRSRGDGTGGGGSGGGGSGGGGSGGDGSAGANPNGAPSAVTQTSGALNQQPNTTVSPPPNAADGTGTRPAIPPAIGTGYRPGMMSDGRTSFQNLGGYRVSITSASETHLNSTSSESSSEASRRSRVTTNSATELLHQVATQTPTSQESPNVHSEHASLYESRS